MWSEPGTSYEEDAAEFIKAGGYTKPLIVYVAGRFIERFPEETVFGHAASIIRQGQGELSTKIVRLRESGAYVADAFDDLIPLVQTIIA